MDQADYQFISLAYILDTYGEEPTQSMLRTFRCERDHDREDYLHNKAIMMEKKSMSRTYLAVLGTRILGYFSIGMKCMRIPDDTPISKTTRKRMNIDGKPVSLSRICWDSSAATTRRLRDSARSCCPNRYADSWMPTASSDAGWSGSTARMT